MKHLAKLTLTLACLSANAFAMNNPIGSKPCNSHTWQHIYAIQRNWHVSMQIINEADYGFFVGDDCKTINSAEVDPSGAQQFGFNFKPGADFDMAYVLTLTEKKAELTPQFTSKTCVFLVTATGPAQPDITVKSFNGAQCDWKSVPGMGEDFYVG